MSQPEDDYAPFDHDYLTAAQITQLLRPINGQRVGKANGFSHVEAYDVRAHLTRIFGFGRWDAEVGTCRLVFEAESEKNSKTVWTVCYLASVLVRVRTPDGRPLAQFIDVATGDATNQPSRADAHDMAAKTAASQALKRAAVNLGDQFGLSLYNKGSLAPLVRGTLVEQPTASTPEGGDSAGVDAHITTPLAPESEVAEDEREYSTPAPRGPESPEAAAAVVSAAIPGATTSQDPWVWCLAEIGALGQCPPAEAQSRLNHVMEVAVRHRLRGRRLPESTETLGATLTRRMNQARAAQEAERSRGQHGS